MSNAFLLTEPMIDLLCGSDAAAKGARLFARGSVGERSVAPDKVHAVVDDDGDGVAVWFNTDLSNFGGFVRNNKQLRRCVAAAMFAWMHEGYSFFPAVGSPEADKLFTHPRFSMLMREALGETNLAQFIGTLRSRQHKGGAPAAPQAPAPAAGKQAVSSGNARWATAAPMAADSGSLASRIDADFSTPQLRELAKWLDVKLKGSSKSGYIEVITAALEARVVRMRDDPAALLEGLSAEQADFARRALTARDHWVVVPRAVLQTVAGPLIGRGPAADRKLTELCEGLRRRALLFPTLMQAPNPYRDIFYHWLPLAGSLGNIPVLAWDATRSSPVAVSEAAHTAVFLNDFDAFLDAVIVNGIETRPALQRHPKADRTSWLRNWEHDADEAEKLMTARTGWAPDPNAGMGVVLQPPLSEAAHGAIESQTGAAADHADWLFALAAALQLVEAPDADDGRAGAAVIMLPPHATHLRARSSAVEEWLALPREEQLRRAWRAWQHDVLSGAEWLDPNWRMMRRIGVRGLEPQELAAEFCALHRYIARILRGLPRGKWIDWPALSDALREFYPDCAWQALTRDTWWFASRASGARLAVTDAGLWQSTVGRVLERLIMGALRWFGAVDVVSEDGRLAAFRLTRVGAWLLNPSDELPAEAQPRVRTPEPVRWLDDVRFVLPPASDRSEFIAFARRIADPAGEAFTYALTTESIERGLRQGVTPQEAVERFRAVAAPLPRAAAERVRRLGERFGRVRVYDGVTVLQLNDDYALRELMATTALARYVVCQLSPRTVIVRDEGVTLLVDEMQAQGYTPKVAE